MSNEDEQLPYGEVILAEDGTVLVMVGARGNPKAATMLYDGNGFKEVRDTDSEGLLNEPEEKRICNMEDILKIIWEHYQEEEYEDVR